MDKYFNFTDLEKNEEEGRDYIIDYRYTDSKIAVIAPHGGGIEPGTFDLADRIAGSEFSFYSFIGLKNKGNSTLHIGSTRFDEPMAVKIVEKAQIVIAIHGCRGADDVVYTGGKDDELKKSISSHLSACGFNVRNSQIFELKGRSGDNICNRSRRGKGVQLEISQGLRSKLFQSCKSFTVWKKTEEFYRFTGIIRRVLLAL